MLIYKPKKAVIIKTLDHSKYTTVFKNAKVIRHEGDDYVAIPHRPDEVNLLRDMGINAPAPMNMYYEYKGRFQPFDVQKQTAEFASMHRRCFILNSMGLGKTVTSLWAYDYLRSIGAVHRLLVVCPLSVMERTWADEVFRSFPGLTVNVLYGPRDKRLKLLAAPADVYVVNIDGLRIIKDAMADRQDVDIVILDEVALFRNRSAARWKTANEICNKQCGGERRVWGLTGSPIPNSPTDAFGQIKLVTPKNPDCPKYFGLFQALLMFQMGQFRWVPKPNAVETVFKMMQPSIRFSLDDAVDLPPQVVTTRQVSLTPKQAKAYKDMLVKLRTELESGDVIAVNEAVKASKLLQICCGVAYGEVDGVTVPLDLDCSARMEVVDEVVCESEGKTIVFVPFSGALEKLKNYLVEQGHSVAVVDGGTSKAERDDIFSSFQNSEDPKVIIANPGTMSHGLTLTAATTICWYGPCYSNEIYQQACARVRRPGQTRSTVIIHIVSTPLEEKIYERLEKKQKMQGSLLDMIRDNPDTHL